MGRLGRVSVESLFGSGQLWVKFIRVGYGFGSGKVWVQIYFRSIMFGWDMGSDRLKSDSGLFRWCYGNPIRVGYGLGLLCIGWNSDQNSGQYRVGCKLGWVKNEIIITFKYIYKLKLADANSFILKSSWLICINIHFEWVNSVIITLKLRLKVKYRKMSVPTCPFFIILFKYILYTHILIWLYFYLFNNLTCSFHSYIIKKYELSLMKLIVQF